ncbi:transglutaminase-like domain-containing protein [Dinoroseobacter sp. S375]|uniref:transglutaminase-like domain-containing protein n=1 Tax=Dinoroseobacter sp. S375 TaxID=3415136 RepID=UPI003C7CA671
MKLKIDVTMNYQLDPSRRVLLALEVAQGPEQVVHASHLDIDHARLHRVDGAGGVGQRTWALLGIDQMWLGYNAEVEIKRPVPELAALAPTPLHALPGEALCYLRPSRFCQSDKFTAFVQRRFGGIEGGAKVAAILDWIDAEMIYVPASSDAETTVMETFVDRQGVCRDYAHMVCALCRAADIPARYASVYGLGVVPQDFHAVAQVWLDGAWRLVDATRMCAPDQMVVIAVGRDACDVAFMETEGFASMITQQVSVSAL